MTARHWIQIVALGSAFGLTGAAIAQNTEGTTNTGDRARASGFGMNTPSAGAIVTPQDKALGMGRDKESNGDANGKFPSSNDEELLVHPRPSGDDKLSVNPGSSNDDESSVNPGSSNGRGLTGPDVNPAEMDAGSPHPMRKPDTWK